MASSPRPEPSSGALGAAATPGPIANVQPPGQPGQPQRAAGAGSGGSDWLLLFAIAVAGAALAAGAAYEVRRKMKRRG